MKTHAPWGRLHLYQIVNYDRREALLALVADGYGQLMSRLQTSKPAPISHWGGGDALAVELIALTRSAADAEERLLSVLAKVRWQGWKLLVWRG